MPVLRFARDRRGYESTYLIEPAPKGARASSCLLYWFRSPPHIKVGRAAFDQDAIRLLEEQHPDIDFDWDRILTTKPPAIPEPREARHVRPERRSRREEPRPGRPDESAAAPRVAALPSPTEPLVSRPADVAAGVPAPPPVVLAVSPPSVEPPRRRFIRIFDSPADAPAPEYHASDPSAAERLLGAEQLTVLRARYAEVLARIAARGVDTARLEALRDQAERANPDAWVTEGEVAAGLAGVDALLADLHRQVGRRRRRRRRGGRGRDVPAGGAPDVDGHDSRDSDASDSASADGEEVDGLEDPDEE